MFKRLRERIAEEATKLPGQLNNTPSKQTNESDNKASGTNSTEDLITLSDSSSVVVPHTSSQFSIGEDEDGSVSSQSTPQKMQNDSANGSMNQQPSFSPIAKDHPTHDLGFGQAYRPTKSNYIPQSDIESEREDPPTLNLESISKDQLMSAIELLKARAYKYKNKYSEVVKNFKELRDEKLKIEHTLIEQQDKAVRRMAELREQCQLEQKAKAHLEANLRLLLEEKDSRITVLETQINLLKENSSSDGFQTFHDYDGQKSELLISTGQDSSQEKIERLEHQFNQAKKTITSQTDQISLLRKQNESLSEELEEKVQKLNEMEDEIAKMKSKHEFIVQSMQSRLRELEIQQEESVMSMAETKKNMHEELELKEKQLVKAEEEAKQSLAACESTKAKMADLQKQFETKKTELQQQLESTEKALEEEKENLMQELNRGKSAAITLMQQECANKVTAIEEEWKAKLSSLKTNDSSNHSEEELIKQVSSIEEELRERRQKVEELNSVVEALENENTSLKSSLEKLQSENALRISELEKQQAESLNLQGYLEKQQSNYDQEIQEMSDRILGYQLNEAKMRTYSAFVVDQLNEKQTIIHNLSDDKNDLYIRIEEMEKEEKDLKNSIEKLNKDLECSQCEFRSLEEKFSQLSVNEEMKTNEVNRLNEMHLQTDARFESLYEELNAYKEKVCKFTAENIELAAKLEAIDIQNKELAQEFCDKEMEVVHLKENFAKSMLELQSLNSDIEAMENLSRDTSNIKQYIASLKDECIDLKSNYNNENNKENSKNNSVHKTETDNSLIHLVDEYFAQKAKSECTVHDESTYDDDKSVVIFSSLTQGLSTPAADKQEKLIQDLVSENQELRRNLHDLKEYSENQDVEFAKNITQLQDSLSKLQEERNNLSLVLQSIETDAPGLNLKDNENSICEEVRDSEAIYKTPEPENRNMLELNGKVKTEISALSDQTETISRELTSLREQFKASQMTYSEKVLELNSRLMSRTEQLLRVKDELDASVQNIEDLKLLIESMEEQLKNSEQSLDKYKEGYENRYKALEEEYNAKELAVKQSHDSQFNDLKIQTEQIVQKLNEELLSKSIIIKEKDDDVQLMLSNIQKQEFLAACDVAQTDNKITLCKEGVDHVRSIISGFEEMVSGNMTKLDSYNSIILSLSCNLNKVSVKLKKKDSIIFNLESKVVHFENENSTVIEENERLKAQLRDNLTRLERQNLDLEKEKCLKNELENDVCSLKKKEGDLQCLLSASELEKNKVEKDLQDVETKYNDLEISFQKNMTELSNVHSELVSYKKLDDVLCSTESEKENLKVTLQTAVRELEETKRKHTDSQALLEKNTSELSRTNALYMELKTGHDSLVQELESANKNLNEKKLIEQSLNDEMLRYREFYKLMLNDFNETILPLYKNLEKIGSAFNENEAKLKSLECMLPKLVDLMKFKCDKIDYFNNRIANLVENNETLSMQLKEQYDFKNTLEVESKELLNLKNEEVEAERHLKEQIQFELKNAQSQLSQLYHLNENFKESYKTLSMEYQNINTAEMETKDILIKKNEEMQQEKIKREQIQLEFDFLQSKVNELTHGIENLTETNSRLSADLQKQNVLELHLNGALAKKVEEIASEKDKTEQLRLELTALQSSVEEFICKNKSLEEENIKISAELQKQNILESQTKETMSKMVKESEEERERIQLEILNFQSELKSSTLEKEMLQNTLSESQLNSDKILEKLSAAESTLIESKEKTDVLSNAVEEWKQKYETENFALQELILKAENAKSELKSYVAEIQEKEHQISLMIPKKEFANYKQNTELMLAELQGKVENFQNNINRITAELVEKEGIIKKCLLEKENAEVKHNDSQKCLKDKFDLAEKNHNTQVDEMKSRICELEKEKCSIKGEKEELSKVREELLHRENSEIAIKCELKSKADELQKLHQKYETTNKEQTAKIHGFQERMKDKENMIVKLKADIESVRKENSEKSEEYKKKIKLLEVEREQLMIQAQERVSKTEAKCREDLKALQEKNNKLLLENSEIEKLNLRIAQLDKELSESHSAAKLAETAFQKEISNLKEQLSKAETKLKDSETTKQAIETDLSTKLKKLQDENSSLLGSTDHFESLKAEKEELNEKLKQAEQQVTSVKILESERDSLRKEVTALLREMEVLKPMKSENVLLREKIDSLEKDERTARGELEDLRNAELKNNSSDGVSLLEKEREELRAEKVQLLRQLALLEEVQSSSPESKAVKDYIAIVRGECESALKAKDEEMRVKLKHLVRDVCIQMDVKDKDCDKTVSDLIGECEKNQILEDRLMKEHQKVVSELRQSLFEQECAMGDMRDGYEERLQEKDKKIKDLQSTIKKSLEDSGNNLACNDVPPLSMEGTDWDDTWAVPEESVENASPSHSSEPCKENVEQIQSLQNELSKCNSEIKELKLLLRLNSRDPVTNNNRRESLSAVPEPTEFEYLKNIIYEYMMGKEPITLAKVIAAVLRFSDIQTQQVIRREEAKHPTK